jgi:hypothetical protein
VEPKILIISWGVFPLNQAMSILVHNLAKAIGPENVVVVGEKCNDDDSWDEVNYPLYHLDNLGIKGINKGKDYLKWLSYFSSVKKIEEIIDFHNCTAILCPFPDEFYIALSYRISKSKNLPFFPWFHNTYLENRTGLKYILAKYLQPKVFRQAKAVLTISEGLTQYYNKKYKNVIFNTVVHCFQIPKSNFKNFEISNTQKIKFAYTGSFNESCKDASVRLCKTIVSNSKNELHVFGKGAAQQLVLNGIEEKDMIIYGFLKEEDFLTQLRNCHIMLLPHGFTGAWNQVEFDTIFPTRTIPLLYSNRPILLHSPENVFLTKFFIANDCGFVVSTIDQTVIENTIEMIIGQSNTRDIKIKNALLVSNNFDVSTVKQQLYKILAEH